MIVPVQLKLNSATGIRSSLLFFMLLMLLLRLNRQHKNDFSPQIKFQL